LFVVSENILNTWRVERTTHQIKMIKSPFRSSIAVEPTYKVVSKSFNICHTRIPSDLLYLNLYKCSTTKGAFGKAPAVAKTISAVVVLVEQILC
jgi:hypothetical protein